MNQVSTLTSLAGLLFIAGIGAIRLTEESIPSHAILADRVELVCNYDMEGDKLYSVKWYRNGQEFYRYIPTDTPDTTVFPYPGIDVDEYKSTDTFQQTRQTPQFFHILELT